MYLVRIALFTLKPGMRSRIDKVADNLAAAFKDRRGFRGATFIADDEHRSYGGITLWDRKEDAAAAFAAMPPSHEQELQRIVEDPGTETWYTVHRVVQPQG